MNFQNLALAAIPLLMITSSIIMVSRKWRLLIFCLIVQYFAMFLLVALVWSIGMAAVKLVVGWMAIAVLATSLSDSGNVDIENRPVSEGLLRFTAAVLVWVVSFSFAPQLKAWIPAGDLLLYGGCILCGTGLIHLGMSKHPLWIVVGLLTFFSGFEILYAVIETSLLVTGLLAIINLGIALSGAYFMTSQRIGETE